MKDLHSELFDEDEKWSESHLHMHDHKIKMALSILSPFLAYIEIEQSIIRCYKYTNDVCILGWFNKIF